MEPEPGGPWQRLRPTKAEGGPGKTGDVIRKSLSWVTLGIVTKRLPLICCRLTSSNLKNHQISFCSSDFPGSEKLTFPPAGQSRPCALTYEEGRRL